VRDHDFSAAGSERLSHRDARKNRNFDADEIIVETVRLKVKGVPFAEARPAPPAFDAPGRVFPEIEF
jgi:hypothetical protein